MQRRFFMVVMILFVITSPAWAQNEEPVGKGSVIMEVEGHACMGDESSRKETRIQAVAETKRKAAEMALTHIRSESKVKDFTLSSDMVNAYTTARVRIIEELDQGWFKDDYSGECYRVKLRAEVIPDPTVLTDVAEKENFLGNPNAPLTVRLWTDKAGYQAGDRIKIFLKGNKPFYARIVYRDASDRMIQLMPNPYRKDNYFNGGVIYEIPSGKDSFDLEVSPPFGRETIVLYSSTAPLGDLELKPTGGIYIVETSKRGVEMKTRGLKILAKKEGGPETPAEFSEATVAVNTGK